MFSHPRLPTSHDPLRRKSRFVWIMGGGREHVHIHTYTYISMYAYIDRDTYIYIYMVTPPPPMTDRALQNIAPTGVFVLFQGYRV